MNLRKSTPFSEAFKGKSMPANKLPTYLDILKHYQYIVDANEEYATTIDKIVTRIEEIWRSASLPYFVRDSIKAKLCKYLAIAKSLKKSERKGKYFVNAVKKHEAVYSILFDICPCKCKFGTSCKCILAYKVPADEVDFLQDMRTLRKRTIDFAKTRTSKRSRVYLGNESAPKIAKPSVMNPSPPSKSIEMTSFVPVLTYFDCKGRAEVTRQLFALAGEEFVDQRLPWEQWVADKNKTPSPNPATPFGQLPIMKYAENKVICQSNAIEIYISRKYNLLGDNIDEEARCMMLSFCIEDVVYPLIKLFYCLEDETAMEKGKKEFKEKQFPGFMDKLNDLLKENASSKYFVGSKINLPDVKLLSIFQYMQTFKIDFELSAYPELNELRKDLLANEKLKSYLEKRPVSIY